MSATMTKRDGLRIGGIVSGILTIPEADLNKAILSGVGKVMDRIATPGDLHQIWYSNTPEREEWFHAAGVGARIPDLDCGKQVALAFTGRHNAFVNQGLQDVLDSAYGDLVADRITHIGLAQSTATVTASTTSLAPTGSSSIKVTANTSRTNQTVHADQTWTQADVAWAIAKIGLLSSSAAADVVNIIGGTGGSAPYNEPFTIDLTSIATWSLTMGIDVTATAS